MRDVAALAGVSLKTVSRVVNDEPGVTEELQRRVAAAMERLSYSRDLAASSLRRSDRRTATVGMVLDNVANPFASAVHRAVEDIARNRDVLVLAASSDEDPERERQLVASFAARRVDGLILMPAGADHSYLLEERRSGTHLVFIDRRPEFFPADVVVVDNVGGVRSGVRHLLDGGHRRIAFLGDRLSIATARERLAGFEAELGAGSIPVDPRLVHTGLREPAEAEAAVEALSSLDEPPTALFTARNMITVSAVRALRRLGLERRVALIGFDDIPLGDLLEPALTVVAQDPVAIGQTAAATLFGRLHGDDGPFREIVLQTRLIVRGSGEIRP